MTVPSAPYTASRVIAPVANLQAIDPTGIGQAGEALQFPSLDPHTNQVWSKDLNREVQSRVLFSKFVATGIFIEQDELSKSTGDIVYTNLEMLISGDGKAENEVLEGNGVNPEFHRDSLQINQLRQGIEWHTRMDRQRVIFDFRTSATNQLADWWSERFDVSMCNQLVGNELQTNEKYTGMNPVRRPTVNNLLGTIAAKKAATLDTVRDMITRAKRMRQQSAPQPIVRPVQIEGGEYWPILADTLVLNKLRASTEWKDNYRAAMQGGMLRDNPIFTGAAGVVDGAILYESTRLPEVVNDTWNGVGADTGYLALLGQGSLSIAYGREAGRADRYMWDEDSWDYGNKNGIAAALIFGMKKIQYGDADVDVEAVHDHGVIVAKVDTA